MNKPAVSPALLQLLVRMYNQSIQSYYFFPDVIICGRYRLEREQFEGLLREGFLFAFDADSFGKLYRLSRKAEALLQAEAHKRKHRMNSVKTTAQAVFSFT